MERLDDDLGRLDDDLIGLRPTTGAAGPARTLEYEPPQGPPVRVRFDRNVKAERHTCP